MFDVQNGHPDIVTISRHLDYASSIISHLLFIYINYKEKYKEKKFVYPIRKIDKKYSHCKVNETSLSNIYDICCLLDSYYR